MEKSRVDGNAYAYRIELFNCGELARLVADVWRSDEFAELNLQGADTAVDRRTHSAEAQVSLCGLDAGPGYFDSGACYIEIRVALGSGAIEPGLRLCER